MNKLALVFAVGSAALLGGSAANASAIGHSSFAVTHLSQSIISAQFGTHGDSVLGRVTIFTSSCAPSRLAFLRTHPT
jgi:hypothetical protein